MLGQTQGNLSLSPRGGLSNVFGRYDPMTADKGLAISNGREPFLLWHRQHQVDYRLSEHARREIERRSIPLALLEAVLGKPQTMSCQKEES